jgi:hypothetical protein
MKYFINTGNPQKCKAEILSCIKDKKDKSGAEIKTWDLKNDSNDKDNKLLVHTTDAWDLVGCLSLNVDEENKCIEVKFYYWKSYPKERRTNKEGFYLYGRFTELLLVHFSTTFSSVKIVP